MPVTRYSPATAVEIEVWDGSPESLAKLREFSGQDLWADKDDRVPVLLSDGQAEVLHKGWCLYRTDKVVLGAKGPGAVAALEDPPAARPG